MARSVSIRTRRGGTIKGKLAGDILLVEERTRYGMRSAAYEVKKAPRKDRRKTRPKVIFERGRAVKTYRFFEAEQAESLKERRSGKKRGKKQIQEQKYRESAAGHRRKDQRDIYEQILLTFTVLNRYGEVETWHQTYSIPPSYKQEAKGYLDRAVDHMVDTLPAGVVFEDLKAVKYQ